MSKDSSTVETADGLVPNKFPSGLRVLLVDDDPTCLEILKSKLQLGCKYEVTPCAGAKEALSLLLEKKDGFDIILTDLHMPDMDGLQLLDCVRSMDAIDHVPVILFSGEQDLDAAGRGIEKGACDFLLKPIRDEALKMIWQHALRLKLRKEAALVNNSNGIISEVNQQVARSESGAHSLSDDATTSRSGGSSGGRKRPAAAKKLRIRWTADLHQKFVAAIAAVLRRKNLNKQSESWEAKAVPKEILDELRKMGVTWLTRQHISSYLQKYRANMKKQCVSSEQQNPHPGPGDSVLRQYSSLSMESNLRASTAPYPVHHQHFYPRNFTFNSTVQQSNSDYQGVGPLPPVSQMIHQCNPIQSPIRNRGPCLVNLATAPSNLQFEPASVNGYQDQSKPILGPSVYQPTTSPMISLPRLIEAADQQPPNISFIHTINQTFNSNSGVDSFNCSYRVQESAQNVMQAGPGFPLQNPQLLPTEPTSASFNTAAAASGSPSFNTQSLAAPSGLDELLDFGEIVIECPSLPWIDDWNGERIEGGKAMN